MHNGRDFKPLPLFTFSIMSGIAVIGIGNPLMGDDGAGTAVLDVLSEKGLPDGVEVIELGSGGLTLLHRMEDFESVVLADAVDFGGKPGEVRLFSPDEVDSVKTMGYSLHDVDILKVIELARQMDQCPDRIMIAAIQPENLRPSTELSPSVSANLRDLADRIHELVMKWAE
jgi:hydrogenase maturation protease